MDVHVLQDAERFDAWFAVQGVTPFTQSSSWKKIVEHEGKHAMSVAVIDGETVVAQALLVFTSLPFGWKYAFCPKGPVIASGVSGEGVYAALQTYCTKEGCIFLRIEPLTLPPVQHVASIAVNPSVTTTLDLFKSPDELLAGMHSKTRYNIRLAEKKNIEVRDAKMPDAFIALLKKTGQRDGFSLHEEKHYTAIIASSMSHQLTAWQGDKPIASAVFAGFGDTFTYVFGASDYEYRQLMAPHLLQWKGIQLGKSLGFGHYDFFGIAPVTIVNGEYQYDQKHQYAGVTRFKLGFGGVIETHPGTFDLLISPVRYKLYKLLRQIRRLF